jgi:restriction system protein
MWMVRSASGGRLADEFREKGVVAIGWGDVGDLKQCTDKQEILDKVVQCWPDWPSGKQQSSASQLYRFRDKLKSGDRVVTYDSSRRIYHVGTIKGDYKHEPGVVPPFENIHEVAWEATIERDDLSASTRNSLGATLTLFKIPQSAASEIEQLLKGQRPVAEPVDDEEEEEDEAQLLERYREAALEFVKDRVSRLDDREMEELVAGLLRAMGYKTRVSDPGPDRGIDILASPDGFGFESPRIIVEVKHRPNSAMGAKDLRTFLGGRHAEDKGLYVSTGGFTKDARYEAERAKIPLMLMDLNSLVKSLMEYYEHTDSETRALVPLTRTYWPA